MELKYICEFVTLAEIGNCHRAAAHLNISQPVLTKHIQRLEQELDMRLFDRSHRRMRLTEFAEEFLPIACQFAELQKKYIDPLIPASATHAQSLIAGTIPQQAEYGITGIFARFQKENPEYGLHIVEEESRALLDMLEHNRLDFAFAYETASRGHAVYDKHLIFEDHLACVLPVKHPLAGSGQLSFSQLAGYTFIQAPLPGYPSQTCASILKSAAFAPGQVVNVTRAQAMLDMVCKGYGVGLYWHRQTEYLKEIFSEVSIVPIQPYISLRLFLYSKKRQNQSVRLRRFLSLLRA